MPFWKREKAKVMTRIVPHTHPDLKDWIDEVNDEADGRLSDLEERCDRIETALHELAKAVDELQRRKRW